MRVCVCACGWWCWWRVGSMAGGGSYMVTGTGHTEINSPSKFKKRNWLIPSCKPHGIILSIGVSLPLLGSNQGGGAGCKWGFVIGRASCSDDGRRGLKIEGVGGLHRDKGNARGKKKSDQAEKKDWAQREQESRRHERQLAWAGAYWGQQVEEWHS